MRRLDRSISCSSRRPRRDSIDASDVGSSGELSTDPRLIAATGVLHSPGNAGELVGECHRDDVVMHALGGSLQRAAEAVLGPVGWAQEYDPSRLHEVRAKITIPALGDATKDGSIAGRDLSRHETKPKSRPRRKTDPSPMVATMALAMIGPMPGTVIRHWQASSSRATGSISPVTSSMAGQGDANQRRDP
jgi:hypothetical protein